MHLWRDVYNWSYFLANIDMAPSAFGTHRSIVELWNAKRENGSLPAWRDFDFLDFEGWWGWLSMIELLSPDASSMVYRLWGTNLARYIGLEMTGKSMTDVYSHVPDASDSRTYSEDDLIFLREVVGRREIGYATGPVDWDLPQYNWMATVRLPLADDGSTVDRVLSAVIFRDSKIEPPGANRQGAD